MGNYSTTEKGAYEFLRKPLKSLVGMKGFEPSTP